MIQVLWLKVQDTIPFSSLKALDETSGQDSGVGKYRTLIPPQLHQNYN